MSMPDIQLPDITYPDPRGKAFDPAAAENPTPRVVVEWQQGEADVGICYMKLECDHWFNCNKRGTAVRLQRSKQQVHCPVCAANATPAEATEST